MSGGVYDFVTIIQIINNTKKRDDGYVSKLVWRH